jgi:hypothetical protein
VAKKLVQGIAGQWRERRWRGERERERERNADERERETQMRERERETQMREREREKMREREREREKYRRKEKSFRKKEEEKKKKKKRRMNFPTIKGKHNVILHQYINSIHRDVVRSSCNIYLYPLIIALPSVLAPRKHKHRAYKEGFKLKVPSILLIRLENG